MSLVKMRRRTWRNEYTHFCGCRFGSPVPLKTNYEMMVIRKSLKNKTMRGRKNDGGGKKERKTLPVIRRRWTLRGCKRVPTRYFPRHLIAACLDSAKRRSNSRLVPGKKKKNPCVLLINVFYVLEKKGRQMHLACHLASADAMQS